MPTLFWLIIIVVAGFIFYQIGKAVQKAESSEIINFLVILVKASNLQTPIVELIDLQDEWVRKSKRIKPGTDVCGLGLWFASDFGLLTNMVNRVIDNHVDRTIRRLIEDLQSGDLQYHEAEKKLIELRQILNRLGTNLHTYTLNLTWPILKAQVYASVLKP